MKIGDIKKKSIYHLTKIIYIHLTPIIIGWMKKILKFISEVNENDPNNYGY